MKPRKWIGPLVAGVISVAAAPAVGIPITWAFTGTIDGVSDPQHQLDGSVAVGTPFSGTYTFESTMTDDLPDDLHHGVYTHPCPPTSVMVLNVGNYTIIGRSDEIEVYDGPSGVGKDFLFLMSHTLVSDPIGLEGMGITCADLLGQVFASDALPLVPPPLEAFTHLSRLSVDGVWMPEGVVHFGGPLTSLTPEPLSLVLIAGGAIAFTCRRPSRRSHS